MHRLAVCVLASLALAEVCFPQSVCGDEHPRTPTSEERVRYLVKKGNHYRQVEDWEAAIRAYQQAFEIDPNKVAVHLGMGWARYEQGKIQSSSAWFRQALLLDPKCAEAHHGCGIGNIILMNYSDAVKDYTRAIELDVTEASYRSNRGNAYSALRMHDKAITDYSAAIRLQPKDARYWNNRADSYLDKLNYQSALKDLDEAIRLNPAQAITYRARSQVHAALGDKRQANRDRQAFEQLERDLSEIAAYARRAAEMRGQFRFPEAIEPAKAALTLSRKIRPRNHVEVARLLDLLARSYEDSGLFGEAEPLYEEGLRMLEVLSGTSDPEVGLLADNLGQFYMKLGRSDKAKGLFLRALQIAEADGFEPVVANRLNSLAIVYASLNDNKTAVKLLERAQRLIEPFDTNNNLFVTLLKNRASLLGPEQDKLVEELFLRALKEPYESTGVLHSLGQLRLRQGRLGDAEAYLTKAYESEKRFAREGPWLAFYLRSIADVKMIMGNPEEAMKWGHQALELELAHLHKLSATISPAMLQHALDSCRSTANLILSSSRQRPSLDADACGIVWRTKGLATQMLHARHYSALIDLRESPGTRTKWRDFVALQQRIAHFVLSAELDRDKELHQLLERRDQLERELTRLLPEWDRAKQWVSWSPVDLQKQLPENSVFVDLLRYYDSTPMVGQWHYLAFVMAPAQPIKRVNLGEADVLDRLCDQWRIAIDMNHSEVEVGDQIKTQIWAKLAKSIPPGTRTVYLSPDGNLARIPWCAIPTNGGVLLEDFKGGIATVPNGIWLLDQLKYSMHNPERNQSVLLVGDVMDMPGQQGGILTYNKDQLDNISDRATQTSRRVTRLTRAEPTRERVRQELPKCHYFHFSWHGFFDGKSLGKERRRAAEAMQKLPSPGWQPMGLGARNPLSYSGLVLTNAYRETRERNPDGILTGDHLLGLDLQKMRLAVLSACQTGLGDLTAAEGVEGLQRAFHVSGCPNVVGSLWDARDRPTTAVMNIFYWELWQNGKPPLEALRSAQLYVYRHPEQIRRLCDRDVDLNRLAMADKSSSQAPTYQWAAFVLSGTGK